MAAFLSAITIGLVVAFVGAVLQRRLWQNQAMEATKQRELDSATALLDAISKAVDARLTAHQHFRTLCESGEAQHGDFIQFREALHVWMNNFSSFKYRVFWCFGRESMLEFEYEVHGRLAENAAIIGRSYRIQFDDLSPRDQREAKNISSQLRDARYVASMFLNGLSSCISQFQFGTIRRYNNVRFGDLDKISRIYLVQRIFNMRS